MAKIHVFPGELIGRIAYFVLHRRSLANGTLVCRSWKMPFQVYLFECISLNFQPDKGLQQLYYSDPTTNPLKEIRLNSARSLRVWNGRSGDWANHPDDAYEHTIINIKFLPMIQSLNLTSICLSHAPFGWESLSLEDTHAVVGLFRRPMLRELMVDAVMPQAHFPLVILPLCPNLQSFSLRYEEVPNYGQVFTQFNDKVAKLVAVYEKPTEKSEQGGSVNRVENQKQDPELEKLGLGPVGAVSLQELILSATALPIFLAFANADGNDVSLAFGARLTLNLLERYNPPTAPTDPPDSGGLPLEKTPWFQVFRNWGSNITELRLHLMRDRAVTRGAYPTREALNNLVNLSNLDLAVDIQDVHCGDADVVANQIQAWFTDFLEHLPAPHKLVHVGIIYRVLVDTEPYRGVPDLATLAMALIKLVKVLRGLENGLSALRDCVVILSLYKNYKVDRNVWKELEQHGVEEQNSRSILSLFPETSGRFKAIAKTDLEFTAYIEKLLD